MEFSTEGTNDLAQATFVGGVDILIVWCNFELDVVNLSLEKEQCIKIYLYTHSALLPFIANSSQAVGNLFLFLFSEDTGFLQCL